LRHPIGVEGRAKAAFRRSTRDAFLRDSSRALFARHRSVISFAGAIGGILSLCCLNIQRVNGHHLDCRSRRRRHEDRRRYTMVCGKRQTLYQLFVCHHAIVPRRKHTIHPLHAKVSLEGDRLAGLRWAATGNMILSLGSCQQLPRSRLAMAKDTGNSWLLTGPEEIYLCGRGP
jgi:hypothetical protein